MLQFSHTNRDSLSLSEHTSLLFSSLDVTSSYLLWLLSMLPQVHKLLTHPFLIYSLTAYGGQICVSFLYGNLLQ